MIFLDTEFTDVIHAELLSLGMVSDAGDELYLELDLAGAVGRLREAGSNSFVRYDGVLAQWGAVAGAAVRDDVEAGRRAAEWLLGLSQAYGGPIQVAFDYSLDWELLEYAIRDAGSWDAVRQVVSPINVAHATSSTEAELAAMACYESLRPRSIGRHHALADALALRAAFVARSP